MKYTKEYWDWNNSQDDLLIKILNDKNKLKNKIMKVSKKRVLKGRGETIIKIIK